MRNLLSSVIIRIEISLKHLLRPLTRGVRGRRFIITYYLLLLLSSSWSWSSPVPESRRDGGFGTFEFEYYIHMHHASIFKQGIGIELVLLK